MPLCYRNEVAHKRQMRAAEQARLLSEILEGKTAAQSRNNLNLVDSKERKDNRRKGHNVKVRQTSSSEDDDATAVFKLESDK